MAVLDMIQRLQACPSGSDGWAEFEDIVIEILQYLFVPPLQSPNIQARSFSGIDRRDAIFANREDNGDNIWAKLRRELNARMILFEFKNYDKTDIGKEEVVQTRSYLRNPMGKLAIICSNIIPNNQAHIKRNTIFSEDGVVILFLTKEKIIEMLHIKERGEDPANLIMDEIELFYIQHE